MRHAREPEQVETRKEAPTVDNNTIEVAATPAAAAFLGARSAWAIGFGGGANHALTQNPVLAAVRPEPRCAEFWQAPAPAMPFSTRKQSTNASKTRISAGGDGAMGPYPEREPGPA
jgi:hypothetical protein